MENIMMFNNATFWTDGRGILFCKLNLTEASHVLNSEKVEKYIDAMVKVTEGNSMPLVIDTRNCSGTFELKAAKLFAKSPEFINLRIVEAYVVNSIAKKMLILSYKRIYDPSSKYKIFSTLEDAINYCNTFQSRLKENKLALEENKLNTINSFAI